MLMINEIMISDNLSDGSNNSYVDVERISSDDEDMRRKILTQGDNNIPVI